MPAHIAITELPAPVTAVGAARPFRLRYGAGSDGDEATTGHWDHIAILDGTGMVQYEDWHREGPLAPGATYEAVVDVGIELEGGTYLVWLTVNGGGRAPERRSVPLAIGDERAPRRPERAASAGRHRIEVDEPPAPLERARVGAPFRVYYTATNTGPAPSVGHYDRLVILGARDLWEGWNPVGPLDAGQRYDAVVDVPGLVAGEYRLEWTLDWAANHPMAVPGPSDAALVRGETMFTVEPSAVANSAR